MDARTLPACLVAAGLWLAQCASAQVVLTASSWAEPGHLLSRAQAAWCEEVARATENRVSCRILPDPVVPAPRTFDAVREGLVDLAYSVHAYTPRQYTLTRIAELPFLGDSAVATSVAYERIFRKHLQAFDEHRGLKVIGVFTHGPGMIYSARRPIARLADLEGLRFRVGGGMASEVAKALGMDAVPEPAPRTFDLLAAGVVDGAFFPAESVRSLGLARLLRHRTEVPGGLYNFAFVMNPDAWERIPKPDREIVEALSGETAAAHFGRYWELDDRRSLALQQAEGVRGAVAGRALVADIRRRTAGLEQAWIEMAQRAGLRDAAQVLAEFRREIAARR
jgi:TRAP-type C4-dicarboxylate transport system substrate-binding protein